MENDKESEDRCAVVSKQWTGVALEWLTDADTFSVRCKLFVKILKMEKVFLLFRLIFLQLGIVICRITNHISYCILIVFKLYSHMYSHCIYIVLLLNSYCICIVFILCYSNFIHIIFILILYCIQIIFMFVFILY